MAEQKEPPNQLIELRPQSLPPSLHAFLWLYWLSHFKLGSLWLATKEPQGIQSYSPPPLLGQAQPHCTPRSMKLPVNKVPSAYLLELIIHSTCPSSCISQKCISLCPYMPVICWIKSQFLGMTSKALCDEHRLGYTMEWVNFGTSDTWIGSKAVSHLATWQLSFPICKMSTCWCLLCTCKGRCRNTAVHLFLNLSCASPAGMQALWE